MTKDIIYPLSSFLFAAALGAAGAGGVVVVDIWPTEEKKNTTEFVLELSSRLTYCIQSWNNSKSNNKKWKM